MYRDGEINRNTQRSQKRRYAIAYIVILNLMFPQENHENSTRTSQAIAGTTSTAP
jgi:hypothetical protein